jgi:HAD superfamily hydrolase (TIGR01509 family)
MISGVILDVDGTLVLSNDAHAHAWVAAYAEFGYDISYEHVRSLIGMGGDKLMATITPGLSPQRGKGEEINQWRLSLFLDRFVPRLQPAPGARRLVERMKENGLRLAIGSSATERELNALLEAAEIADLVHRRTTSSQVDDSKPAPDIPRTALDELAMDADEVLMLGDTPFDIESAGRAGIRTVAVLCGGWVRDALIGAIAIYADPADIADHYEDSPFAQENG